MGKETIPGFDEALDIAANSKIMLMGISGQILAGMMPAVVEQRATPEEAADMAVIHAKALLKRLSKEK